MADLNSVEKSLADLFRRYEKMKEVLEGFRKVCLQSWSPGGGGEATAVFGGGEIASPEIGSESL